MATLSARGARLTPAAPRQAPAQAQRHYEIRRRAAALSVWVGVVIMVVKVSAYLITSSATILSDGMESVVHVAATGFMYWCLRYAHRPADTRHPYGHGKAEYLSVGFEGGTITIAALGIIGESIRILWTQRTPEHLGLGALLIAGAGVVNLVLGLHLRRIGRQHQSAILTADAQHVLSDMLTSLGVVAGVGILLLIHQPRWQSIADASIGILLAVLILRAGIMLIREAMRGLLDLADPVRQQQVLDAINAIRRPDWLDIHRLRVRTQGDWTHIDMHMTVPGTWTVVDCHETEHRLEEHLLTRLACEGSLMVHFDYAKESGSSGSADSPGSMSRHVAPRQTPFSAASATRLRADSAPISPATATAPARFRNES